MATQKQSKTRRLSMAERAQQQMAIQFPNCADERLWHRKRNDGYSTIPRTLPLAMQCIDARSKGQPAGHTLLCLWIRAPDFPFLTIEAPTTFAAEAGFEGERAVDTWRRRMRSLRDLGFIEAKKGPSGDFHYVLLLNPNVAIEVLRRAGKVQDRLYGRFRDRLIDIGAQSDISAYDEYLSELTESLGDTPARAEQKAKRQLGLAKATARKAKSSRPSESARSTARPKPKER